MWNITNAKKPFAGQASRDDSREPVIDASDDKLSYLLQFASWVKLWQSKTVSSLSKETSTAVHQTSIALVACAYQTHDHREKLQVCIIGSILI